MRETKELAYCKSVFNKVGKIKMTEILDNSNLNNREVDIITSRLIKGMSLKECSSIFAIEENSVNRAQLKAVKKLYNFLRAN